MSMPAPDPEEIRPAAVEAATTPDSTTLRAMLLPGSDLQPVMEAKPAIAPGTLPDQTEPLPAGWTLIALVRFRRARTAGFGQR